MMPSRKLNVYIRPAFTRQETRHLRKWLRHIPANDPNAAVLRSIHAKLKPQRASAKHSEAYYRANRAYWERKVCPFCACDFPAARRVPLQKPGPSPKPHLELSFL